MRVWNPVKICIKFVSLQVIDKEIGVPCCEEGGRNEFMIEVSGVYQTLPALWRNKSDDYSNRAKKAAVYDILLQKYHDHFTPAALEDPNKKYDT